MIDNAFEIKNVTKTKKDEMIDFTSTYNDAELAMSIFIALKELLPK